MRRTRRRSSGIRSVAGRRAVVWAAGVLLLGPNACYEGYRLQAEASGDAVDASAGDEATDAGPICPGNLAGRMDRGPDDEFENWLADLVSHREIAADETVVVRLAIIPFVDDTTIVTFASSAPSLYFTPDGFVTEWYPVPGFVPYKPGRWNIVDWTFNPVACRGTFEVNGVSRGDYALYPMTCGLRLEDIRFEHASPVPPGPHPGPTAWVDGISVVVRSPRGDTTLFADNFPTAVLAEHWGRPPPPAPRIRVEEPPVPLDDPMGCEPP